MASDILLSHIQIPHYSDKNDFNDHLFEDKILDIDDSQYENCDILRNILNNSLQNQNDKFNNNLPPKAEPRISVSEKDSISKKIIEKYNEKENIYENVNFFNKYFNVSQADKALSNCSRPPTSLKFIEEEMLPNNCYRSTLSLVIGKPSNKPNHASQSVEILKSSDGDGTNFDISLRDMSHMTDIVATSPVEHEESDDGSFKSSYAKSLMDSFHRTANSPSAELSRLSSPISNPEDSIKSFPIESVDYNLFLSENHSISKFIGKNSLQTSNQSSTDVKSSICYSETVEKLEKKIRLLSENACNKDKELEKLKHDLITLRLDFNRIKAENRCLKVAQNMSVRNSPNGFNGESQPSSLTSISACSDIWTLQQQVMNLNTQLEKAELSRHAYEAASRQLVHFLQTINTTLITVAGNDSMNNSIIPDYFNPIATTEILTRLENTIAQKKFEKLDSNRRSESPTVKPHWFDSNREGSFISNTSVEQSNVNNSYDHSDIKVAQSELKNNRSGGGHKYAKKDKREKILRSRVSSFNKLNQGEVDLFADIHQNKTISPQRTNSIPRRILHSTKKALVRSESVNDIPTEPVIHIPRVSRAMSTHCVNKIDALECRDQSSNTPHSNSHRLVSARAKGFFTSLRSIFKIDNEKSAVDTSNSSRKKLTLPLKYRSSKAKYDMPVPNLFTTVPSQNSSFNLVRKNASAKSDIKTPVSDISFDPEKSLQNSIFYVPCYSVDTTLDNFDGCLVLDDFEPDTTIDNSEVDTSRDEVEVTRSTISAKNLKAVGRSQTESSHKVQQNKSCDNSNDLSKDSFSSDFELSGPQEISVTLSFHQDKTVDNDSGKIGLA